MRTKRCEQRPPLARAASASVDADVTRPGEEGDRPGRPLPAPASDRAIMPRYHGDGVASDVRDPLPRYVPQLRDRLVPKTKNFECQINYLTEYWNDFSDTNFEN